MALVLTNGSDAYGELMYGKQDESSYDFLRAHAAEFNRAIGGYAQQFFSSVEQAYQNVSNIDINRRARAALRKVSNIWQNDGISHLDTVGKLQQASHTMQRWLMAEPYTREVYHRQQCEGYNGSYRDVAPNDLGESHYDYRRVVNGVFVEQPSGDFAATSYNEQLHGGEQDLDIYEQADILHSWEFLRHHLKRGGDDPTSRINNSL